MDTQFDHDGDHHADDTQHDRLGGGDRQVVLGVERDLDGEHRDGECAPHDVRE
jgi:hypothetical protein